MQDELAADHPEYTISLLTVNEEGYDAGLPDLEAVTDLPMLQDDSTQQVWTNWSATWRDVIIVGNDGAVYEVYNLTSNDLSDSANYSALYDLLLGAAAGS